MLSSTASNGRVYLQVADIAACEIEPGSASRVVLGREQESLMVYDLEAQRLAATVRLPSVIARSKSF